MKVRFCFSSLCRVKIDRGESQRKGWSKWVEVFGLAWEEERGGEGEREGSGRKDGNAECQSKYETHEGEREVK